MFCTLKLKRSFKKLFIGMIFVFVVCSSVCDVLGTTYSKPNNSDVSLASGTYRVNGTATYNVSGDTRWSYSSENMIYKSGVSPKGYGISSKKTVDSLKKGNVQRTGRKYNCYATNVNYTNDNKEVTLHWYFNTNTYQWQTGF